MVLSPRRRRQPDDWSQATDEDLHELRKAVVALRYQIEFVEDLWPRMLRIFASELQRLRSQLGKANDLCRAQRFRRAPCCRCRAGANPSRATRRRGATVTPARATHCRAGVLGIAPRFPAQIGGFVAGGADDLAFRSSIGKPVPPFGIMLLELSIFGSLYRARSPWPRKRIGPEPRPCARMWHRALD